MFGWINEKTVHHKSLYGGYELPTAYEGFRYPRLIESFLNKDFEFLATHFFWKKFLENF